MKKKSQNTIFTLDYYNERYYKFSNSKFEKTNKIKYNKNSIYTTYISNSDLIIEAINLSNSLAPDTIYDIITDKVYEELKLDLVTEYDIVPIKTAISGNEAKYQTLIVNVNELKNKLDDLTKKIKYIDYVLAAPLLYKILYVNKNLESKGCDAFLYFSEKETFITFYYKGEYLYSKTLKYSIDYIYDRVCQLAQEVFISKEDFIDTLAKKGFKNTEGRLQELITQVFNECFLNLNDIVIYTKRVYDINKINNLYIGFSFGYLDGINSYSINYLNLKSVPLSNTYTNVDPKISIDPIHSLMLMSTLALEDKSLDIPNFTPFPKPAPLFKRPAGKLIQGFIFIALLFTIPIIYYYIIGFNYSYENKILSNKEKKLQATVNHYKSLIKSKKDTLKKLDEEATVLKRAYNSKLSEIRSVYNKKYNYMFKSEQLALLTKIINKYDIKSKKITIKNNKYLIDLESSDDKEITSFIKELVKDFKSKIANVNIDNIKYSTKEHLYKGVLIVEFTKE